MGLKTTIAMMNSSQTAIVAKDKKEALEILAPKEIKDGKILNFRGRVIGGLEGAEDQVFHSDEILEKQSRITQAFVSTVFKPLMDLLNTGLTPTDVEDADEPTGKLSEEDIEDADEKTDDVPVKGKKSKKEKKGKDVAAEDVGDGAKQEGYAELESAIEKAISSGKGKKAKKLLATLDKDHPSYKQYKKSIKALKEGN